MSSSIVRRTVDESCSAFDPGAWKTPIPTACLVVQQRAERVVAGGELESRHVAEPRDLAVGAGLEDDVAELLLVEQAAARVHAELIVDRHRHRRGAHHAGRDLHVLLADGAHDVAGRQPAGRHLAGVQPDPHGVVAAAEYLDLAHPGNPADHVLDLQQSVVPQIDFVVPVVRRDQVDHHDEIGRALDRRDAELADFVGEPGQGLTHPVLHLHLGQVDIGADTEGHRHREHAVRRGLG